MRDADTGVIAWARPVGAIPRQLSWSADGRRLLVLTRAAALVLDADGRPTARIAGRFVSGALSPRATQLALAGPLGASLVALGRPAPSAHPVFAAPGVAQLAFSPDSRWLLVTWPSANEWVFVGVSGRPRLIAVSHVAEQFGGPLPRLEGWCCTAGGAAG